MIYKGQELATYDLWDLGQILADLELAVAKRTEASNHPKFQKMQFPPPNPEFLKLKTEVENLIRERQPNA